MCGNNPQNSLEKFKGRAKARPFFVKECLLELNFTTAGKSASRHIRIYIVYF
jgi:hypothetical protein